MLGSDSDIKGALVDIQQNAPLRHGHMPPTQQPVPASNHRNGRCDPKMEPRRLAPIFATATRSCKLRAK